MKRRGFTIVEVLVALALTALIIALATGVWRMSVRAHGVPEPLAERAALRALLACLAEDLLQLGTGHDQLDPIRVTDGAFAFQRTSFAGQDITLAPVAYRFVAGARGAGRLVRTESVARKAELPAVPLSSCRFARIDDPRAGHVYLLVHLVGARTSDRRAPAEVSALLPLPSPSARGNPALAACAVLKVTEELPAL
jgi:prepilin-type N-terminal cleavage/methylation domain-containing protein